MLAYVNSFDLLTPCTNVRDPFAALMGEIKRASKIISNAIDNPTIFYTSFHFNSPINQYNGIIHNAICQYIK
jgi:hypothetical protein